MTSWVKLSKLLEILRLKILSGGAVAEKKMPPFLFLSFLFKMCPCRTGDVCVRHTRELHASSENVRARVGRRKADGYLAIAF